MRDFERFLSENFYENKGVEIVAVDEEFNKGQHINVRVKGDAPRDLHNLGDGIGTLIILMYKLFMAQEGSWVFIEEPELNLHPGLQRVFLQTLFENQALRARNLRIFFTTHSNHLLRMTLKDGSNSDEEISVFAFQKRTENESFLIRPLISEHHHALALLGVQNASVLLAQCGIWVEGPTDRYYLRAYLQAYMAHLEQTPSDEKVRLELREDNHYAFWEYGGTLLAHYLFDPTPRKNSPKFADAVAQGDDVRRKIQSSALCNRIFLLADQDKSEGKQKKHEMMKEIAAQLPNFHYCVTPGIEIENLLSAQILRDSLPSLFTTRERKVSASDVAIPLFQTEDYKKVGLGTFLRERFPDQCPENLRAESGTLSAYYKEKLAKLAVTHVKWETMSKDARRVTRELYRFLIQHNNI